MLFNISYNKIIRANAAMVTLLPYTFFVPHLNFFLKFLLPYLQIYQFTIVHSHIFLNFKVGLKTKFSFFILLNILNSLLNVLYKTEPLQIIEDPLICTYTASFKITKGDCSKSIQNFISRTLFNMSIINKVTNNNVRTNAGKMSINN